MSYDHYMHVHNVPRETRKLFSKLVPKIKFLGLFLWIFMPHFYCVGSMFPTCMCTETYTCMCRKVSYKMWLWAYFSRIFSFTCNGYASYKNARNFPIKCVLGASLNTTVYILNKCRKFSYMSVKCCTSAGNIIPALQLLTSKYRCI